MNQYATIALSHTLPKEMVALLAPLGHTRIVRGEVSHGTRIFVCGTGDPIDGSLIRRLPASVQLIAVAGSETDRIDLEAARACGIKVSNTPLNARSVPLSLIANIAAFIDRGFPLDRVCLHAPLRPPRQALRNENSHLNVITRE
ncbi:hypothetical protein [Marinobacterium nitratireducens]|uniref:hypothetical protein n=1 Tax=Marinobacterium nitratireducens TaxID=518897 RepID=UPI00166C99E0|nr:hypothetical protein [Marinobacterium nitratireducens]